MSSTPAGVVPPTAVSPKRRERCMSGRLATSVVLLFTVLLLLGMVMREVNNDTTRQPAQQTLVAIAVPENTVVTTGGVASPQYNSLVSLSYPEIEAGSTDFSKQAKLLNLFTTVSAFLNETGVQHWLDYGTLLGGVREQRLMLHDRDVDFSVLYAGWDQIVANKDKLATIGCSWTDNSHRHQGRRKGVITCPWFHKKKTEGVDIYGWETKDGAIVPPTREMCKWGLKDPTKPCGVCPVKLDLIFPLNCSSVLHNVPVCYPASPTKHLVKMYGTLDKDAKCNKRRCCKPKKGKKAKEEEEGLHKKE